MQSTPVSDTLANIFKGLPGPLGDLCSLPASFETVERWLGPDLSKHPRQMRKIIRHDGLHALDNSTTHFQRALGALGLMTDLCRLHRAMEQWDIRQAVVQVESVPLLPSDYRVDLYLAHATPQAMSGLRVGMLPWNRPRLGARLKMESAFPDEWLGYGVRPLVDAMPTSPLVRPSSSNASSMPSAGTTYEWRLEAGFSLMEAMELVSSQEDVAIAHAQVLDRSSASANATPRSRRL